MGETPQAILKGKRVVITRAAEQSHALVQALRDAGAMSIVLPMVAFGPPDDLSKLDAAIRAASGFDWIFITSQNALRAIQERCQELGADVTKILSGVRIAAVGPATADALERAGLNVAYTAAKHQGVSLAEELAEQVKAKRVLLPRSDRANSELVGVLNGLGAEVTEVIAYRTLLPGSGDSDAAQRVVREGADAVLFFSPSSVHHLSDILGRDLFLAFSRQALFAAIGPVTAEALHAAGVGRVVLAGDTTVRAILQALANTFSEQASGLPAGVKSR